MSIEISNVNKRFGDFVALEDVNVSLPTGQLGRETVGELRQVDQLQQLVDPGAYLRLRLSSDLQTERDVLGHGHVLEHRVVLEHESDVALLR